MNEKARLSTQAELKVQGCTNLKLRQLMRRVAAHYDAEVGKSGLRGTQYSLLSYVVKLGPIRPADLAAEMRVSPSTLTRNLKPLVDAGWLEVLPGEFAR
jgi:DNA-binding MarR family transcriptional regulator